MNQKINAKNRTIWYKLQNEVFYRFDDSTIRVKLEWPLDEILMPIVWSIKSL